MVVKKRGFPLSFDGNDSRYILPITQDMGSSDRKEERRQHRPLHEEGETIEADLASWPSRNILGRGQRVNEPVLPTFSSHGNPQSADTSPVYQRRTIVFTAKKRKSSLHTVLWLAFVISGLIMYANARTELRVVLEEAAEMDGNKETIGVGCTSHEFDTRGLEREVYKLETVHWRRLDEVAELHARETANSFQAQTSAEKEILDLQNRVRNENESADTLRKHVQRISRDSIQSKYGPGPHRVEFTVDFGEGDIGTFVAEMAPHGLMPHSVQSFLDMVAAKLWDSTSFIANEDTLIKAAPVTYEDGTADVDKLEEFTKLGLEHLAFTETSSKYTHKKYTLGFTGGETPSWFINTADNTKTRKEQPCFATIVDGLDTVKKIEQSQTYSGHWLLKRIGIKFARIL